MRAAIFNEPRSISVGDRPDPAIAAPTDAVVRVVLACVCGSDLWPYRGESPFEPGPIGHEFVGVVEDVGAELTDIADDVMEGRIDPGRVLDFESDLDGIAEAYAAMDERRAIKSLVRVGTV
jgi:threonine dehydrogenase-like Zn-dependent dehydrogenase